MSSSEMRGTLASIGALVRATWASTFGDRTRVCAFILLFFLVQILTLAAPQAMGALLGVFAEQGFTQPAMDQAIWFLGAYIGLNIVAAACHHFARYLQGTAAYSARFNKLEEVFTALLSFPLRWHVSHHSGENLSRLHRSVGAIESMVATYVWQIIEGISKFLFAAIALFTIDGRVAVAVLILGTLTVAVMLLFNARLAKNIRKNNRFYDRQHRTCMDYLSNVITVKTLHLEEPAARYLRSQRQEGFRLSRKIWKYQELKWGSVALGSPLVIGTSLLLYFNAHKGGDVSVNVGALYILVNYLERIFGAISAFTGYYGAIIEAGLAYDDAWSFISESNELKTQPQPSRLPRDWAAVRLDDVRFSYGRGAVTLNASFELRRNEKIALVGPSGGGKSTLLKVIAGMLQTQHAEVSSGETAALTMDDVAGVSLLVPQDPEIFSETVRYNLTLGQSFSTERLEWVTRLCKVDNLIERLPKKWDENLEEAGLNISTGERQRLALARGLLRAPGRDILLLDEPTSSIDPQTERRIFAGILEAFKDHTILSACHRLALVPLFDRIIYVRNGRIEETGTFDELRAAGGGFAAAWQDYERKVVVAHESAQGAAYQGA